MVLNSLFFLQISNEGLAARPDFNEINLLVSMLRVSYLVCGNEKQLVRMFCMRVWCVYVYRSLIDFQVRIV